VEFRKSALYASGERGKQLKGLLAVSTLIPLLTFPISSYASSSVSCLNRGVELRPDFIVRILHGDKPLPGGSVWVSSGAQGNVNKLFSSVTAVDGTVCVVDLPPGEYWRNARLLGIVAAQWTIKAETGQVVFKCPEIRPIRSWRSGSACKWVETFERVLNE
jgi:hypothetical protein